MIKTRQQGFSLIEMLIASAILMIGVAGVLLWQPPGRRLECLEVGQLVTPTR
ncbi:prepilin-type N-terminal cleavage/methylation domain-containing protein [bacterium]|nr:prepilin-type N-terminal cleavage/methylation domain-containing protein [bacterium]